MTGSNVASSSLPHTAQSQGYPSLAQVRQVFVSDTAAHQRFTPQCAALLHAL